MFSHTGTQHTYNVEEITFIQSETESPSSDDGYFSEKGETTVSATSKLLSYQFRYTNTLSGETQHVAYKFWKDAATEGKYRPDLYLELYQYVLGQKESTYTLITDYPDALWTTPGEGEDYDWKITASGLPKYSADGVAYEYEFVEKMNNSGHTVQGDYVQTVDRVQDENGEWVDEFTNTITDTMEVTGVKTWIGMTGYNLTKKDLPTPTLLLYRITGTKSGINGANAVQEMSEEEIQGYLEDGTLTLIDSIVLQPVYSEEFRFPETEKKSATEIQDKLDNNLYVLENETYYLPKYSPDGDAYYYFVREELEDTIANQLYQKVAENGTITNKFLDTVNRRSIRVTKIWNRGNLSENEKKKYPSVTYYLYRYTEGQDANQATLIKTGKISASVFANSADGSGSYTFKDLLTYSPSGKKYYYYVKEKSLNGYNITYYNEDDTISDSKESNITSIPDVKSTSATTEVKTKNSYDDAGSIQIHGRKNWDDYKNSELIYGNRPSSIEIELYRATQDEVGQSNKIEREKVELDVKDSEDPDETRPYIVWNTSADMNYWEYRVYNLERYAPNGMPYIYSIKEVDTEGYTADREEVTGTAPTTGDTLEMSEITNRLNTSYYVRKNWSDGSNKYGFRPESVTIVLERSIDKETWETIRWESDFGTYDETAQKWTGLPTADAAADDPIVSIALTSKYEKTNTEGDSWEYTFTNLPVQDAKGRKWYYRCVETKIGNTEVVEENGVLTSGAYECIYTRQADDQTIILNKQDSTKIEVEKVWVNDNEDLYKSRPESLAFKLQVRERNVDGSAWEDVTVQGNETFTVSKSDNWTTALKDLPVARISSVTGDYEALEFRVIEATSVGTEEGVEIRTPNGADNYIDRTDYSDQSPDHTYDMVNNQYISTIRNELIVEYEEIDVTKKWFHQDPTKAVSATFELLYQIEGEADEVWHCFGNVNGETLSDHSETKGCVVRTITSGENDLETVFKWTKLPKYTKDGKQITYKVIEYPVEGYRTTKEMQEPEPEDGNKREYTFCNIELQDYTVTKIWINTAYSEKEGDQFTAEFQLQSMVEGGEWTDVEGRVTILRSSDTAAVLQYTWKDLPKYSSDGTPITYRAVEKKINGKEVTNDTNGAYIVSYQYGNELENDPAFANSGTTATNRMIYGFVNLRKEAAYLSGNNNLFVDKEVQLKDAAFNIYKVNGEERELWAEDVKTDEQGYLVHQEGRYGENEGRYLTEGTYILVESKTQNGYSLLDHDIRFQVGVSGSENTGEHGTAWITTKALESSLTCNVTYIAPSESSQEHEAYDSCQPEKRSADFTYNMESRGVITFNKYGTDCSVNTHESHIYFGVYTDPLCTNLVAGLVAQGETSTMVLTDKTSDGENITIQNNADGLPYLRNTGGEITLLSGTYYLKELVPPPGYKKDDTVRTAKIATIKTPVDDTTDLRALYSNNKAKIDNVSFYTWENTENVVELYKLDQYGRKVTLKNENGENGYLEWLCLIIQLIFLNE